MFATDVSAVGYQVVLSPYLCSVQSQVRGPAPPPVSVLCLWAEGTCSVCTCLHWSFQKLLGYWALQKLLTTVLLVNSGNILTSLMPEVKGVVSQKYEHTSAG